MNDMLGTNPENNKQRRVFFCAFTAADIGEKRHPQKVMAELAEKYQFKILSEIPQSMFDGWDIWIESSEAVELPKYLKVAQWKPVGQA